MNTETGNDQRPFFVFPCSGAADVGEISDRAARQFTRNGNAKMYCMAGIAAGIETMTTKAKETCGILAIDGCPMECNKKILDKNGFKGFKHIVVTSLGMTKGAAPATEENVRKVVAQITKIIAG